MIEEKNEQKNMTMQLVSKCEKTPRNKLKQRKDMYFLTIRLVLIHSNDATQ